MPLFDQTKKFFISSSTAFWSKLATFLSFAIYVITLVVLNTTAEPDPYFILVLRDISLFLFTILLTTYFTSKYIEAKGKNELYRDTILQDVLANPTFYQAFSDDIKETMLKTLERDQVFFGYSQ